MAFGMHWFLQARGAPFYDKFFVKVLQVAGVDSVVEEDLEGVAEVVTGVVGVEVGEAEV